MTAAASSASVWGETVAAASSSVIEFNRRIGFS
jgi:hypothetical protein